MTVFFLQLYMILPNHDENEIFPSHQDMHYSYLLLGAMPLTVVRFYVVLLKNVFLVFLKYQKLIFYFLRISYFTFRSVVFYSLTVFLLLTVSCSLALALALSVNSFRQSCHGQLKIMGKHLYQLCFSLKFNFNGCDEFGYPHTFKLKPLRENLQKCIIYI